MNEQRLVPMDLNHGGMDELSDALYLIARNIETGFILMDATPGEDYTRKDLMEMALEFAMNEGKYALDVTVYE